MKERRKTIIEALCIFLCLLVIVIIEIVDIPLFSNQIATTMLEDSISRILGGIIFMIILISYGYKTLFKFKGPFLISLLIIIPSLIISINNFPIVAFLGDRTQLIEPTYTVYIFLLECLSTGFFEEIVFRGLIFVVLLQKLPQTQKGILLAVIYSSALFGAIHIFNMFAGASFGNTTLQVGYSFLMGMMWAIVFLKTKNIWIAMFLHATYNFFGQVMFALGTVDGRYDIITVIVTVLLAILVALYMIYILRKITSEDIKDLYTPSLT